MTFPTNTTPPWQSYTTTQNPADIVKSTTVATAIGGKVDATSGQILNPTISGGVINGATISNSTLQAATTSSLGAVQIGSGLSVTSGGIVSSPPATTSSLGSVIVGANLTVTSGGTLTTSGLVTQSTADSTYVPFAQANAHPGYVALDSSGNAAVAGTFSAAGGAINVSAGSVQINQPATCNSSLLVDGALTVGSNTLNLAVGGTNYALVGGAGGTLSYDSQQLLTVAGAAAAYVPYTKANSANGYVALDAGSNATIAGSLTGNGQNANLATMAYQRIEHSDYIANGVFYNDGASQWQSRGHIAYGYSIDADADGCVQLLQNTTSGSSAGTPATMTQALKVLSDMTISLAQGKLSLAGCTTNYNAGVYTLTIPGQAQPFLFTQDATGATGAFTFTASSGDAQILANSSTGGNRQIRLNALNYGGFRLGSSVGGDYLYCDNAAAGVPTPAVSWWRFYSNASTNNPSVTVYSSNTNQGLDIDPVGGGIINLNGPSSTNNNHYIGGTGFALLSYSDGNSNIGGASNRFATVYATTGTINTSDETEKTISTEVSLDKLLNAVDALDPIVFQFNDSIKEKGAKAARVHAGHSAQGVYAALQAQGIDPARCGLWCEDALTEAKAVMSPATEAVTGNDDPSKNHAATQESFTTIEHVPLLDANGNQVKRQGLRYEQLHNLLHAANKRKITALEAQVAALQETVNALVAKVG